MVLDWLVTPILSILTAILGVLPTDTSVGPELTSYSANFPANIQMWVQGANEFIPMGPVILYTYIALVFVMPALIIFEIAQWGYRELPDLWGFGPS